MATVTFKTTQNRIEGSLNQMIGKAKDPRALLNTAIPDIFKQAQVRRWDSDNATEGAQWAPLTSKSYIDWKKKKYANAYGAGQRIMIASGKLHRFAGAENNNNLKKIVTTRGLVLSVDSASVPYAKYAVETRPIMSVGQETSQIIKDTIRKYLTGK